MIQNEDIRVSDLNNIDEFLEASDDEMIDIEEEEEKKVEKLQSKEKSLFTRKELSHLLNHVRYEACELKLRVLLKNPLKWILRKRGTFHCSHYKNLFGYVLLQIMRK